MSVTTYLDDYQLPNFAIDTVELNVDIWDDRVEVRSILRLRALKANQSLVLNGNQLQLKAIALDGKALESGDYTVDEKTLTVHQVPKECVLTTVVEVNPYTNTALSGLYSSNKMLCTQCEPQGFRRITYFLDRPDVLSRYSCTISADVKHYPTLLSNGNCVDKGQSVDDRHWVKWEDPHPKPCYLFALVAGQFECLKDEFVTLSGRKVSLELYSEKGDLEKCQHAMQALKKAMKWDEQTYGREYDLDVYMIVAANDFNAGAMENKGLNIFNAKYILADPKTATDTDYQLIDAVVGHEYFHNWSGNRVTCRDWFQLSLKEGLTVFREHQFSSDISKSPVSLIDNVAYLRAHQFPEDSGPMAHPIRPESYEEINNFYTMTVYEKGAEVIRMLKNLLGEKIFRLGMDHYFSTYDGQAVTTDDFITAMEEASKQDLSQFRLWYSQAGTPVVRVTDSYDSKQQRYNLTLEQSCPETPGQAVKKPFLIPITVGLIRENGQDVWPENKTLVLKEAKQNFSFDNVDEKATLSCLREFSAPVKIELEQSNHELAHLMAHDSDAFNRWESSQKLTQRLLWKCVENHKNNKDIVVEEEWLEAQLAIITDTTLDPGFRSKLLTLPAISYLIDLKGGEDLDSLIEVRRILLQTLAQHGKDAFLEEYQHHCEFVPYQYTPEGSSIRRFRDACLYYLVLSGQGLETAMVQWEKATNMTDTMGVLNALNSVQCSERTKVFDEFYEQWHHNALVLDKWYRLQATSEIPNTLENVKKLSEQATFDWKNPNRVYSLVGGFVSNTQHFHAINGTGYEFLADAVLKLDALNPQVASRMAKGFSSWKCFDTTRQSKVKAQLERLQSQSLSKDVSEVVSKSLR